MYHPHEQPDLILTNANVLTLDERLPFAQCVSIQGGKIQSVGADCDIPASWRKKATVVDCQGRTLMPGLIDAHCHLLAYASSLMAVDCSPSTVASIADIQAALREKASKTPPGEWIRATGYSEFDLSEKRHPNRWDLDNAVPDHPVRLNHRSGHASVLNSAALSKVGISIGTDEPTGGVIDRILDTGEPNGLLMEMEGYLKERMPPLSKQELREGIQAASRRFASYGITSIQDASPHNSAESWDTFHHLKNEDIFGPRITMMVGTESLADFRSREQSYSFGDNQLNLGHAKVMLTRTTGTLFPSEEQLEALVSEAHEAGFPIAIHAVEAEAVEAAIHALARVNKPEFRNRIEHCSECPPHLFERLHESDISVVTQPSFLYFSGLRYLQEVQEEIIPWLYPIKSLSQAGINVGAGSDAPVVEPNAFIGMYAAVTRKSASDERVNSTEGVSVGQALRMYTINAAYSASQEMEKGSIKAEKLADLVLLNENPVSTNVDNLKDIKVLMTMIGGKIVWEA